MIIFGRMILILYPQRQIFSTREEDSLRAIASKSWGSDSRRSSFDSSPGKSLGGVGRDSGWCCWSLAEICLRMLCHVGLYVEMASVKKLRFKHN